MSSQRYFPRFCCLLLLGLLLCACAGRPAEVAQKTVRDQQWLSSMQTGRSAYDQGQFLLARRLFAQALERGRQMDRAEDITDATFNLAATQIQLGDFNAANSSLQQAKSEIRRSGDSLSEILLLEARTARLQRDEKRSRAIIEQLLQQLPATERRLRSQALLLGGLLACEAGDKSWAIQHQARAAELLANDSPPLLAASQAELQGCINLLQQQPLAAAGEFDRQTVLLQQAHQYRQMVNALRQAGIAYAAAGQNDQAAERLFRGARSAFSQKRFPEAQILLEKAESFARTADDKPTLENIARLRTELSNDSHR